MIRSLQILLILSSFLLAALPAVAETALERIQRTGMLRSCIWPEYSGVTYRNPLTHELSGIDIDMAQAFANDLKVSLRFVDSTFPTLVADLAADRCDIAMFAMAINPGRARILLMSTPYLRSDVYVVIHRGSGVLKSWGDIDRRGVRLGVLTGTYFEQAMRGRLQNAQIVPIATLQNQERELRAGRVDGLLTNLTYSRRIAYGNDWARILSPATPFLVSDYGYAVKLGETEWIARVDQFLALQRASGGLLAAARKYGLESMLVH